MQLPFGLDRLFTRDMWRSGPSPTPLDERDPEFIRAELPRLALLMDHYNQVTVEGLEHLGGGRALLVGNHNGGVMSPDMFALMIAHWRAHGVEMPAYGLMHDLPFRFVPFARYLAKLGAVPASPANAIALLERDAKVLVYPGGDVDAFKASSRRHEIVFGQRRGFIRIALRARAPIIPVVSIGAHEAFHVFTDGAELARRLGLKRLFRMEVLPIVAGLPWGVWIGPVFFLPLPVRMKLRVLPPIVLPHPPEAADDDIVVQRCKDQVQRAMQTALDEMVGEGGYGRRSWRELLA